MAHKTLIKRFYDALIDARQRQADRHLEQFTQARQTRHFRHSGPRQG